LGAEINDASTLGEYAQVIRRRKWIVIQAAILIPAAVLAFTLTQSDLYRGEAQVLLNAQDPTERVLGSVQGQKSVDELDRDAATQAEVAHSPELARGVLRSVEARGQSVDDLLDSTAVDARSGSDLLTFQADDPSPSRARRIADAFASEYVRYRAQLAAASIEEDKRAVAQRLASLDPGASPALSRRLRSTLRELETVSALQGAGADVVRRADDAEKVRPRPVRNTAIGFVLGLVVGLALAFVRDLFDRRVRSADEAASLAGLPLLARLPGRELRQRGASRLPLIHEPEGSQADAYRTLMYRLQMANADHRAQVILVTSAVEGEGKTTTAANLALALARTGQRTALVELDL